LRPTVDPEHDKDHGDHHGEEYDVKEAKRSSTTCWIARARDATAFHTIEAPVDAIAALANAIAAVVDTRSALGATLNELAAGVAAAQNPTVGSFNIHHSDIWVQSRLQIAELYLAFVGGAATGSTIGIVH